MTGEPQYKVVCVYVCVGVTASTSGNGVTVSPSGDGVTVRLSGEDVKVSPSGDGVTVSLPGDDVTEVRLVMVLYSVHLMTVSISLLIMMLQLIR